MATKDPIKIIADILTQITGISADRVVTYNQNWKPPTGWDAYIIVKEDVSKDIANNKTFDPDTEEEVHYYYRSVDYIIDVSSADNTAREINDLVKIAVASAYAENQAELYQLKISRRPQVLDVSFIEGARALTRKRHTINVMYSTERRIPVAVYDKFFESEVLVNE
jgi:hypothetical protein